MSSLILKFNQEKETALNDLTSKLEKKYLDENFKQSSDSKSVLDSKVKDYEDKLKQKGEEYNQLVKLVDSERNDAARKYKEFEKTIKDINENVSRLQEENGLLKNQLNILENEFSNNKMLHKTNQDEMKEKIVHMDQEHKDNIVIYYYLNIFNLSNPFFHP